MNRYLILLLSLFFAVPLCAQSRQKALLEYQARRRQAYVEFQNDYRKACVDFMRQRWEVSRSQAPVPLPDRREPDRPVIKQPDSPVAPSRDPIAYDKVIDRPALPLPVPDHKPAIEEKHAQPTVNASRSFRFTFYGTVCSVSLTPGQRFRLTSLAENSVANVWERISGGSYDSVVRECSELKKDLRLNDWGYYDLVRTLCDGFCGNKTGESVILQSFLMAEAGCKVRLARGDNQLFLLLATTDQLYGRPYFQLGGDVFYILDDVPRASSYNVCNFTIPGERSLSMAMPVPPALAYEASASVTHKSVDVPISTTVCVNRNLMDFYANYPPCYWSVYAATELTVSTQQQLYPALHAAIAGKSTYEAANLLLHYLHEAFAYKTDDAQFGDERTLFAEEMFRYPYSDCEDRSILFARLVKDLLKLKVVLLYYPAHIATAVCFDEEVAGDYLKLGSARYVICDPTYIGSDVGDAMPDLKGVTAQVVKID